MCGWFFGVGVGKSHVFLVTGVVVALDVLDSLILGFLQGVFEWLPISSEGNVSIILTVLTGSSPGEALGLALFLHAGTAGAAALYYRGEIVELGGEVLRGDWMAGSSGLPFYVVASVVSGVVGVSLYVFLIDRVSGVSGAVFVVGIGVLLIGTGVVLRVSDRCGGRERVPGVRDAVLVGGLQGLAILPGVSRSGVTTGALLLRGYGAPSAFRFSFILGIPATLGGAVLGMERLSLSPVLAVAALVSSFVTGYVAIGVLMRVAEEVRFWKVCLFLGLLAVVGGFLTL